MALAKEIIECKCLILIGSDFNEDRYLEYQLLDAVKIELCGTPINKPEQKEYHYHAVSEVQVNGM